MTAERLEAIREGLTGGSATLNLIGILVVCLIFMVMMYFGYQYQKNQIAGATLGISRKSKNRRRHTRINLDVPVLLRRPDGSKSYEARIQDVSLGGIRLITPVEGIAAVARYIVEKPESKELSILRDAEFYVLWVNRNKDNESAVMRGRWINLPKEKDSALQYRIKTMIAGNQASTQAA